jgi:MFS family permease
MERVRRARQEFHSTFSTEMISLRRFLDTYPLLALGITFLVGTIVGGLLSAWPSQFVILALLGGFSFAIALGSTLGIPSYVSIGLVVPILAFTTYAGLRILRSIDQYDRVAPYLMSMRKKYNPISTYLVTHAGVFGVIGIITISTFLIGWWVTIIIAYLLNVKVSTAMKGTGIGLLIGAFFFWVSYEGLMRWIPNPPIITAITVVIFSGLARIITYKAQHRKPNGLKPFCL